jgi:hypothetical protein
MSDSKYNLSNPQKIYRDIDISTLVPNELRKLHYVMSNTPIRKIRVHDDKTDNVFTGTERKNFVVFTALACREALEYSANIFIRFIGSEIISFIEKKGLIKLIYKDSSIRANDLFIIPPYSENPWSLRNEIPYRNFVESTEQLQKTSDLERSFNYSHFSDYRPPPESYEKPQIIKFQTEIQSLSDLLQKKKKELDYYYDKSKSKDSTISDLTVKLKISEQECFRLSNLLKEKEEIISDFSTAIDNYELDKKTLLQNFNISFMQRDAEIRNLHDYISNILKETTMLKAQMDPRKIKLERTNAQLMVNVNILSEQNSSLSLKLNEKEKDKNALLAKISMLEEENSSLKRNVVQISPTNIDFEESKKRKTFE